MDWSSYKEACDRPRVVSRWLLEQTCELLDGDDAELGEALRAELGGGHPLPKPDDHRGGPATDMFQLALEPERARRIRDRVAAATAAGRVTTQTAGRGLGGFLEAWSEYLRDVEDEQSDTR